MPQSSATKQINPVQSTVAALSGILSGTLSTLTVRLPQQPTYGNCLILLIGTVNGTTPPVPISSVTSTGATWSQAVTLGYGLEDISLWYAPCVAQGASPIITITTSSPLSPSTGAVNTAMVAVVAEFPGVGYISPLDQTSAAYTGYSSSSTGTTNTTTQAAELWIAGFFDVGAAYTTDFNGFTCINPNGTPLYVASMWYKVVNRTGQATDALMWYGSSYGSYMGVIATFKLATAPLPSPPNLLSAYLGAPPYADIVRVQGNGSTVGHAVWSSGSSFQVTNLNTPAPGDLLVAIIGLRTTSSTQISVSSITQTGVTWTKQASEPYVWEGSPEQNWDVETWVGVVGSSPGATPTINLSAAPTGTYEAGIADVFEYNGLETSGFLDQTATNNGNGSESDTGTAPIAAQPCELQVGAVFAVSESQSTPTNGFTLLDGVVTANGSNGGSLAYLENIVSTTETADSGTTLAASNYWVGCMITLKAVMTTVPSNFIIYPS